MSEVLVLMLGFSQNPGPVDLLSMVDAEVGLGRLGERTDTASLRAIARKTPPEPKALSAEESEEAERHVQNLASSMDAVREWAQASLVALGSAILPRLREVAGKDPRRAEAAKAVIRKIETAERSRGASAGIARLLAIRLLGERKDGEALPILAACAADPDPFVRIYAEAARARIEGREPKVVVEEDPTFQRMLASLPEDTFSLIVFRRVHTGPRVDPIATMHEMAESFGGPADIREQMARELLRTVRRMGNVGIDAAAFAISGRLEPGKGSLTAILGGIGDPERIVEMILTEGRGDTERISIAGVPAVAATDGDIVLAFPSDRVAVAGFDVDEFPSALPRILANFKAGTGGLRGDDPMARFAGGRAREPGVHALLIGAKTALAPALADAPAGDPAFRALLELEGAEAALEPSGKGMGIRIEGTFGRPDAAKELAGFLQEHIRSARKTLDEQAGGVPESLKPAIEKMRGALAAIRIASSGAKATIEARLEGFPLPWLMMGLMMPLPVPERRHEPVQERPPSPVRR